ncbi:MAG: hypothetical protein ACI3XT_02025 [Butyricicoccaceae bacterium]
MKTTIDPPQTAFLRRRGKIRGGFSFVWLFSPGWGIIFQTAARKNSTGCFFEKTGTPQGKIRLKNRLRKTQGKNERKSYK